MFTDYVFFGRKKGPSLWILYTFISPMWVWVCKSITSIERDFLLFIHSQCVFLASHYFDSHFGNQLLNLKLFWKIGKLNCVQFFFAIPLCAFEFKLFRTFRFTSNRTLLFALVFRSLSHTSFALGLVWESVFFYLQLNSNA